MNQQDKDRLRELAETAIRGSGGDLTPTLDFESACSPQAILSLLEENEALARDAGRYRHLRMMDWFDGPLCVVRDPKTVFQRGSHLGCDCPSRDRLDVAIDAAMQPKGE